MQRIQTTCLVILTLIASGFALHYLQPVLLPFVIAFFIVSGCRPVLDYLEGRFGLHWMLSFAVTFSIGVILLAGFSFLTWLSIHDLSDHFPAYRERIEAITEWIAERFPATDEPVDLVPPLESADTDIGGEPIAEDSAIKTSEILDKPSEAMKRMFESLGDYAQAFLLSFAGTLTSLLSSAILVLIFVFFLLLGRAEAPHARMSIAKEIDDQIRKYIVVKTIISALTGLATWLVLWLFGVPLAIVFGLLTFLINFVPNIGPVIISLLPVPFLVLNEEMHFGTALIVFGLVAAIQFVSGNVVETRVMGRSFDVNPIILLLSLMFFGLIWGIPGMFLATPIVSIIKIILQERESTRPFADFLAGRWDVTQPEETPQEPRP